MVMVCGVKYIYSTVKIRGFIIINLITDKWVQGLTLDGKSIKFAPNNIPDNVRSLNFALPSLNGAVIQFLIGIEQTKPDPINFSLTKFMQEQGELDSAQVPIQHLLIESPGEATVNAKTDHFIKDNQNMCLCESCAAAALYSIQTNAPQEGGGRYVSLRGGCPITTIILKDTVKNTVLANVLPDNKFRKLNQSTSTKSIPWADSGIEYGDKFVTTADYSHDFVYWAMPRRIKLNYQETKYSGICSICGEYSDNLVNSFQQVKHGLHIDSNTWVHPLSPYRINTEKGIKSVIKMRVGGMGYKYWVSLLYTNKAEVITHEAGLGNEEDPKIWTFGFSLDGKTLKGWHDSIMPIINADEETAGKLIKRAETILWNTKQSIKFAFPAYLEEAFWANTESDFYSILRKGADIEKWHKILCTESMRIFEIFIKLCGANLKMETKARNKLMAFNCKAGK